MEDRNKIEKLKLLKEPLFLKAGDEVLVYRIESVVSEKVVIRYGETTKDLKVGDSFPDAGLKAPEGVEVFSEEAASDGPSEAKSETKPDSKLEAKSESKSSESSTSSPSPDEDKRKKILEELRKKAGKKSRFDPEN